MHIQINWQFYLFSFAACQKILDSIQALDEDDFVIVIITGGGSSLLPHPIQGISLAEKIELISDLSKAGADIVEINNVRRQLSLVKGGGLAKFLYPAKERFWSRIYSILHYLPQFINHKNALESIKVRFYFPKMQTYRPMAIGVDVDCVGHYWRSLGLDC